MMFIPMLACLLNEKTEEKNCGWNYMLQLIEKSML